MQVEQTNKKNFPCGLLFSCSRLVFNKRRMFDEFYLSVQVKSFHNGCYLTELLHSNVINVDPHWYTKFDYFNLIIVTRNENFPFLVTTVSFISRFSRYPMVQQMKKKFIQRSYEIIFHISFACGHYFVQYRFI